MCLHLALCAAAVNNITLQAHRQSLTPIPWDADCVKQNLHMLVVLY